MRPDELLASFDEWGKNVADDLGRMEGDIYIWPLLNENLNSIYHVYDHLYASHYRNEILDSMDWMRSFLGSTSPGAGFVIAQGKPNPDGFPAQSLEFVCVRELTRLIETEQEFLANYPPL